MRRLRLYLQKAIYRREPFKSQRNAVDRYLQRVSHLFVCPAAVALSNEQQQRLELFVAGDGIMQECLQVLGQTAGQAFCLALTSFHVKGSGRHSSRECVPK